MSELVPQPKFAGRHWRHFVITPTGVDVTGKPSFAEWAAAVRDMKAVNGSMMWVIGDLLLYGEGRFGEAYSQVLDAVDYSDETLKVCQRVAARFAKCSRLPELSFKHHQEVAALPAEQALSLLRQAEAEGLSTRDVRQLVRAIKGADECGPLAGLHLTDEWDAIRKWLYARREGWPEMFRPKFTTFVGRILDGMRHNDHVDHGGGGAGCPDAGAGAGDGR